MNDAANLRRRITSLERQLHRAWRLKVEGLLYLVGAAVVFVAGVVIAALGWGWRGF